MVDRFSHLLFSAAVVVLTAMPLASQQYVVASRLTGNPATVLTLIDVIPGVTIPISTFASANLPPRAVAFDPINRGLLLALESGTDTRIVRLSLQGATVTFEQTLNQFAGIVTDIAVDPASGLWAALDGPGGGLLLLSRTTGQALSFYSYPRTVAMEIAYSGTALIVQQVPNGSAVLSFVDLATGSTIQTASMGTAPSARPTGITDLPTGAIRQAVSEESTGLFRFEFLNTLSPWPLAPPLPSGSPVEIGPGGQGIMILGGASFPFLATVPIFGNTLTTLSSALPGAPVDFAEQPGIGPALIRFGSPCPSGGTWTSTGLPQVGSTTFALGLQGGVPSAATALLLGLSDLSAFGQSLPWLVSPSCSLLTSAEIVLLTTSTGTGSASFTLPIPAAPGFSGSIIFGQWIQSVSGLPILSDAFAAHLAP